MAGKVTVACKLPNGLLLRLFDMAEEQDLVMGGGFRSVLRARDIGIVVKINGNAAPPGQMLVDAQGNPISTSRGFALTRGVDADFWDTWLEQNRSSHLVQNGLIFAHERFADIKAEAEEKKSVRTGLEPMNPAGDVRMPAQRQRLKGGTLSPLTTSVPGAEI